MLYKTAKDWQKAKAKKVMLFGMSGLGKTYVSNILRDTGAWFHYSVDYRIGTRYMGEHIVDNFKMLAMQNPFLADLLRTDSIYIASNITFENLAPLSTYLGKPGNPDKGGIPFEEYLRRQRLHRAAEINAMLDTVHFIERSKKLYNYDNFICDTSGSVVEVVDPNDPKDPVLSALAPHVLPVWIEGDDSHLDVLAARFDKAPKPMYYPEDMLTSLWGQHGGPDTDPDAFIRKGYRQLLDDRLPRYRAIANNWGVSVPAKTMANVQTAADFETVIADALERRAKAA